MAGVAAGGFHHHHFGPGIGIGLIAAGVDDGCYVTRRVMTPFGYRLRTVNVCVLIEPRVLSVREAPAASCGRGFCLVWRDPRRPDSIIGIAASHRPGRAESMN